MFRLLAVALLVVLAACSNDGCSQPDEVDDTVGWLAFSVCVLRRRVKKLEEARFVKSDTLQASVEGVGFVKMSTLKASVEGAGFVKMSTLESKLTGYTEYSLYQGIRSRLNNPSVYCYNDETTWTGRSDARIMNLDRHNLECPKPYFLARFQLKRSGYENHSNVRYEYRCCKVVI